jgi:hypothetical protein
MLSGSAASGCPQWSQNFARSLIRAKQCGQIVSRSCSRSVKSAPQNWQCEQPSLRGAPHEEQRTTEASCPCGHAIVTIVPHRQRNRLPIGRSLASYCRPQAGQAMSRRIGSQRAGGSRQEAVREAEAVMSTYCLLHPADIPNLPPLGAAVENLRKLESVLVTLSLTSRQAERPEDQAIAVVIGAELRENEIVKLRRDGTVHDWRRHV